MKFSFKVGLFILALSASSFTYAQVSMRRCMLLPVQDEIEGAVGFPVYEEIEYYLKNSDWCYYRSNSGIIDILGNYKKNLKNHLNNKDVLKVIAEKTKSGSLLKIEIENELNGQRISLSVIGENGEDLYFSEETILEKPEVSQISRTIRNWLEEYEKAIPYDGMIAGVLGDQFTTDFGREYGARSGDPVKVVRPMSKEKHPLLKEIVEWETQDIAQGELFHVGEGQAQARALEYFEKQGRLSPGDWVILQEREKEDPVEETDYTEDSDYRFGKLGRLGLGLILGKGSATLSAGNSDTSKIGGFLPGVELDLELWMTRNYWFGFEFAQKLSSFSEEEGDISLSSNSASWNNYKVKFGYKYLPLGFFYGPQVDFYAGYARYGYGLDTSRSDGLTETSFKGLHFGSRGTVPFMKQFKAFLEIEFIFNPGFSEAVALNGDDESTSTYHIGAGGVYEYDPKMSFYGSFDFARSSVTYKSSGQEYKLKESTLTFGTQFTF